MRPVALLALRSRETIGMPDQFLVPGSVVLVIGLRSRTVRATQDRILPRSQIPPHLQLRAGLGESGPVRWADSHAVDGMFIRENAARGAERSH